MIKKNSLIQYDIFESFSNLTAFTTRKNSFETEPPRFTGSDSEVSDNRRQLAELLDINPNQLVFPRQTHTNCVVELSEIPDDELKNTDALVTNRPGICLCVQTADCAPILLLDPAEKAIAAVHAGWRGTVARIAGQAVLTMKNTFGTDPKHIFALVGPSISPDIYEVGEEVINAARKNIPQAEKAIRENPGKKPHFDLWEANRRILLKSGILSKNIKIFGECSYQKSDDYYSARRDGIEKGRNVSGIMLL